MLLTGRPLPGAEGQFPEALSGAQRRVSQSVSHSPCLTVRVLPQNPAETARWGAGAAREGAAPRVGASGGPSASTSVPPGRAERGVRAQAETAGEGPAIGSVPRVSEGVCPETLTCSPGRGPGGGGGSSCRDLTSSEPRVHARGGGCRDAKGGQRRVRGPRVDGAPRFRSVLDSLPPPRPDPRSGPTHLVTCPRLDPPPPRCHGPITMRVRDSTRPCLASVFI